MTGWAEERQTTGGVGGCEGRGEGVWLSDNTGLAPLHWPAQTLSMYVLNQLGLS